MSDVNTMTHLDIGLSKEDMERISAIRDIKEGKKRGLLDQFAWLNAQFTKLSRVTLKDKVTFFELLSVMINAGVPLIRSLEVLSDQTPNLRLQSVIREMSVHVQAGVKLSEAMADYPSIFNQSELGMVASGEVSGRLDEILKDIAHQSEKTQTIQAKVRGAMIYPISILFIMGICITLILTLVVPKLTGLFAESGKELPWTTRTLINGSAFLRSNWSLIALGLLALMGIFWLVQRNVNTRRTLHAVYLHIPVTGPLLKKLYVSRFARVLASLLDAGLPIVKALEINAQAMGNEIYRRRIGYAAQDVAQGIPLGENLTDDRDLFPPMVASMVLIGEQTAKLSTVLKKIAEHYESELDISVNSLTKIMEPLILVVMGSVVGFTVAAIMQPILALSDMASMV